MSRDNISKTESLAFEEAVSHSIKLRKMLGCNLELDYSWVYYYYYYTLG